MSTTFSVSPAVEFLLTAARSAIGQLELRVAQQILEQARILDTTGWASYESGLLEQLRDDQTAARSHFETAWRMACQGEDFELGWRASRELGRVDRCLGDQESAFCWRQRGIAMALEVSPEGLPEELILDQAEHLLHTGETNEAEILLNGLIGQRFSPQTRIQSRLHICCLQSSRGERGAAISQIISAIREAIEYRMWEDCVRCARIAAELFLQTGDLPTAKQHLNYACRLTLRLQRAGESDRLRRLAAHLQRLMTFRNLHAELN